MGQYALQTIQNALLTPDVEKLDVHIWLDCFNKVRETLCSIIIVHYSFSDTLCLGTLSALARSIAFTSK